MTDADLARLEQAAQAATPGPWTTEIDSCAACRANGDVEYSHVGPVEACTHGLACSSEDAAYIAAASPGVVLALIAEVRRGRERDAKFRQWLESEKARYQLLVDEADGKVGTRNVASRCRGKRDMCGEALAEFLSEAQ